MEGSGRFDGHFIARPQNDSDPANVIREQIEFLRIAAGPQFETTNGRALAFAAHAASRREGPVHCGVDDYWVQLESDVRHEAVRVHRVAHARHSACYSFRRNLKPS